VNRWQRVESVGTSPKPDSSCWSGMKLGGNLPTARVVAGTKAARSWSRLSCGTWEPLAPMRRENSKWLTHEGESTEAGRRGGSARSSWEAE
jgi:hypothetical protein